VELTAIPRAVGAFVLSAAEPPRAWAVLLSRSARALVRRPPPRDRLLSQMFDIGNRSVVFVAITLGFLGAISVFQGVMQASRVLPDYSMVGATLINVMTREFGPTITALMIATRVGTGIAAEIGSMVVTDQVEAMKVSNTDPVEYLVAPRVLACLVMTFVLTVFAVLVAVAAGALVGYLRFQIGFATFFSMRLVDWADLWEGLVKCAAYGVAIPVIAAESGFRASGGSEGVGWATTRSVVNASFAVIFMDFIIASVIYLVTG